MSVYKTGSNQYVKVRKLAESVYVKFVFVFVMAAFALLTQFFIENVKLKSPIPFVRAQEYKGVIVTAPPVVKLSPTVIPTSTPSPTPTIDPQAEKSQLQADIEAYMKTIFGPEFRVARAVSHNECNPANAKYPECVLHTKAEYSVGLFQINLYNASQWIHAGRIPGSTMEEKVEWLKDPYNNTLYAYWLQSKSGWYPWTAFTSGNYKRSL